MAPRQFLINIRDTRNPGRVGNKARNLRLAMDKGFRVPETYVLRWDAYQEYVRDNIAIVPQIRAELEHSLRADCWYAVRSSANVEDSLAFSFAGQFKTMLDVRGIDAVFHAVWSIWATASSDSVQVYMDKLPQDQRELKMAVIIQEMVTPVCSGVAFSKNPVTGVDEIVVEAVHGSGVGLVQGGLTPDRWVFRRGEWATAPESQHTPVAVVEQVVAQVRKAVQVFKRDVDMEWVYDGRDVFIVQMRDITSISQVDVYSSRISKDMLPGMIKPLVWSLNVPMLNTVIVGFLTELTGKNDLDPLAFAKPFYYRAYFNMTLLGKALSRLGLPSETLDMMMGVAPGGMSMPNMRMHGRMVLLTPRLLSVLWDKLRFHKKMDAELPQIEAQLATFTPQRAAQMSDAEIIAELDRLYRLTQRVAYLNLVGPLLMLVYNYLLNRRLKDAGVDPQAFDLMHGIDQLCAFQPGHHLRNLNAQFMALDEPIRQQIIHSTFPAFLRMQGLESFQHNVRAFLERFGHLSDSGNDISVACWRETPELIKDLLVSQTPAEQKPSNMTRLEDVPQNGPGGILLRFLHRRARRYRLYREHVSFVYTKTYGTFRPYWLALGERLVQRGILRERDDVFYLYLDETRAALSDAGQCDYGALAGQRKSEMDSMQSIALPVLIYGDTPPPVMGLSDNKLTGTPTSRGVYTGRVRVIHSLTEIKKMDQGDVLVVPYSDVGWTPLFARAGGVIAESGGMLSHSSIIAREYHIPAVVSVAGATLLRDNMLVTVDGYKGEVLIHTNGDEYGSINDGVGSQPTAQAI